MLLVRSVVVALGLVGCGFRAELAVDAATTADGADATIDAPVPLGPWSPPRFVPIPGSAGGDDDPSLTGDRLEMYFNRLGDIYVTKRGAVTEGWATPVQVAELSSGANETTPEVTSDGLTIFVASARAGTSGGDDIWMATRPDRNSAWSTPTVITQVSSPATDGAATVTDDLLAMVLTTNRDGMGLADLYITTRATAAAAWDPPVELTTLVTASNDFSPILSQDKLMIYWDSDTGANEDLYVATRASTSEPFGTPMKITELDTVSIEADPWVSADGRHIMFVSNRSGMFGMYESSR